MCGIVGVVYGPGGSEAEKITPADSAKSMFPNVEHRGRDAFGWIHYTGKGKGQIQLRKWAMPAGDGVKKGLLDADTRLGIPKSAKWWIGHVRLATHGTKNYVHNNHPIVHGDIMGVHNGICYNYSKVLKDTGRQFKKAEVDSEAIFAAIHKYGIVDGLDKLDALAATVFVDKTKPNTVYFATCDANPLIVARSKGGATYFASESWILDKLDIEWAEEPWKMGDYTLYTLVDGVEEGYVQYANPDDKAKEGWGRFVYSSGYGGYNVTNPTNRSSTTTYSESSESWDEYYSRHRDGAEPDQMNADASGGFDNTLPDGFVWDDEIAVSADDDEADIECLHCGWYGDEDACDDGTCPKCGSMAYLMPRGVLSWRTIEDIQASIDAEMNDEAEPGQIAALVSGMKLPANSEATFVLENGQVLTKDEWNAKSIVDKALDNMTRTV